jgi:hypothetical protein
VAAIINTGSLWLYEGPSSQSPTPLLVSRLVARGLIAHAASGVRLQQPIGFANDIEKRGLNAGAVDPKGFWNGGVSVAYVKLFHPRLFPHERVESGK